MTFQIQHIKDVYTVKKPWGQEQWIQAGNSVYPYVLKQLNLLAGNKTSLQVHRTKSESIIILEGTGRIEIFDGFFDCRKFLKNGYSQENIESIKNQLQTHLITSGSVFHTPPGTIHRMIADTDLLYIEASTTELDDVIRIQDDNNRQHGRIESEHSK